MALSGLTGIGSQIPRLLKFQGFSNSKASQIPRLWQISPATILESYHGDSGGGVLADRHIRPI
jgi:hypothetical protein